MASTIEIPPVIPPNQRVGQLLGNRYELRGGLDGLAPTPHSLIHLAFDREKEVSVIVKELHEPDVDAQARVSREIATHLALTKRPNIIPLYDTHVFGMPETGQRAMVLELATGGSLRQVMTDAGVDIETTIDMARSIVPAIEAVHSVGLVHCDIKPANILADREHTRWWLADFGIVEPIGAMAALKPHYSGMPTKGSSTAIHVSNTGTWAGSLGYMAPENATRAEVRTPADIYGFGATMYNAIAGELPHEFTNFKDYVKKASHDVPVPLHEHKSDVPIVLEAMIMSCLEPKPGNRPTLDDLDRELRVI